MHPFNSAYDEMEFQNCLFLGADPELLKEYLQTHPLSLRDIAIRLAAGVLPQLTKGRSMYLTSEQANQAGSAYQAWSRLQDKPLRELSPYAIWMECAKWAMNLTASSDQEIGNLQAKISELEETIQNLRHPDPLDGSPKVDYKKWVDELQESLREAREETVTWKRRLAESLQQLHKEHQSALALQEERHQEELEAMEVELRTSEEKASSLPAAGDLQERLEYRIDQLMPVLKGMLRLEVYNLVPRAVLKDKTDG